MVTRAFAELGTGDDFRRPAFETLAALDQLTDEGEPILSVWRADDDSPWTLDILFTDADEAALERWLGIAREMRPEIPPFQFDALAERDWVAESQKALHPIRAARFIVHGSHDRDRLLPSRWRLEIDAGRAFGTAHHASTQGCLEALDVLARRGPLGSVHDVGTGSGILAIAAERLGAWPVSAGDLDPEAVDVARANVRANRGRPIPVRAASGATATADTVIANILARPLVALAPNITRHTRRMLILSGLRRSDARRVTAAYRARGLVLAGRIVIGDWVTLILRRPRRYGDAPREAYEGTSRRPPRAHIEWLAE
jgi:ribosomal protein L11 methyltransferase